MKNSCGSDVSHKQNVSYKGGSHGTIVALAEGAIKKAGTGTQDVIELKESHGRSVNAGGNREGEEDRGGVLIRNQIDKSFFTVGLGTGLCTSPPSVEVTGTTEILPPRHISSDNIVAM